MNSIIKEISNESNSKLLASIIDYQCPSFTGVAVRWMGIVDTVAYLTWMAFIKQFPFIFNINKIIWDLNIRFQIQFLPIQIKYTNPPVTWGLMIPGIAAIFYSVLFQKHQLDSNLHYFAILNSLKYMEICSLESILSFLLKISLWVHMLQRN